MELLSGRHGFFASKPVGWALSRWSDSNLTKQALNMAYELGGKSQGVIFSLCRGQLYLSLQNTYVRLYLI